MENLDKDMDKVEFNKGIITRLSRIEGQIRGVKDMLDSGRKCEDVMIQLSAINSAINNAAMLVLNRHISHCVVDAIKNDDMQVIEDLRQVLAKFANMKSGII